MTDPISKLSAAQTRRVVYSQYNKGKIYRCFHIGVGHEIGDRPAILFDYLLDRSNYYEDTNQDNDGWFFHTAEMIYKTTCQTQRQQVRCLKILEEFNLIETKLKGAPPRKWFRINGSQILHFMQFVTDKMSSSNYTESEVSIYEPNSMNLSYESTSKEVVNNPQDRVASSGSNRTSLAKAKRVHPVNEIIERFTDDPNTPTHRRTSQLYADAASMITHLKRGTFFNKHREIDYDYLTRNGAPPRETLQKKKWKIDELMLMAQRAALYYSPDHWPKNKGQLSGIKILLYNPNTKKSWFIAAFYSPPGKIERGIELTPMQEKMFTKLRPLLTAAEDDNLKRFIIAFDKWFVNDAHADFNDRYNGKIGYLWERFCVYVDWRVKADISKLTPDGITWKRWLRWIAADCFIDPITGKRIN